MSLRGLPIPVGGQFVILWNTISVPEGLSHIELRLHVTGLRCLFAIFNGVSLVRGYSVADGVRGIGRHKRYHADIATSDRALDVQHMIGGFVFHPSAFSPKNRQVLLFSFR
jgi:hypothetical protein